ncbi:MAG: helix-turn-helix domain-containing protein [Bacteroidales bacterium]|jgi:signal transduction histidine kinase/ligand-binding sensor domain-containing protein/DNA-binding response OmpR family regulator|nr:helix-turn-helix domain-containing protein [Bacteroidales bacterium]
MRFLKTGIIVALFSALPFCATLGQQLSPGYKFHTCSPEGGFYYDGIRFIRQDKAGFIWILMDNDLYRFDGYQYVSYYPYFQNLDRSVKWTFHYMETDTLGQLYVVANNKLFVHHANNRFEQLLDTTVVFLKIDAQNHIWLKMPDLHLYHPESGALVSMMYHDRPVPNISTFWNDGDQLYAVSAWGTVYRVDPENGEFALHGSFPNDNYYLKIIWKNHVIWTYTHKNKLYCIDGSTFTVLGEYDFFDIPENYVNALYVDQQQNVWIGTRRGLYILNPQTGEYPLFRNSRHDPFSIPDNSVWAIDEDRQQNIWIGTYSGGLCYMNPNEKNYFESYSPKDAAVNYPVVSGFAQAGENLWIATEGGGINIVHSTGKRAGKFSYLEHQPDKNSLAYNNVKSMVTDSVRGNIWISMFQGGLDCYHIPTKTFTHYKNVPQNENGLRFNNLRKIVLEPDSGLWIAYQNHEFLFSFYSFGKRSFEHFSAEGLPGENYIFDICRDAGTDDLWIATHRKLYRMNVRNKQITEIPSADMLHGQTLCVDSDHHVWIGTLGKGLVKYSVKDSMYHTYDDILKFRASAVYSMCADRYDCLWLGTDNGLFRFDPQTGAFMQFIKDDGIQGNIFYPLASMQSKSGELFFGGTTGFTVVTDPDIRINPYQPKAMLSDILVNNVSVLFDTSLHIRAEEELVLRHDESNIGFLFSSDNYLTPAKNRFKSRLAGYDDRWVETDASNRHAFYTKLPAGQYVFEALASNNDGLWSNIPLQVKIRRLPAPWLSLRAYALYVLMAILTLFLIFRYYYRQKQLKLALYKESMEKRQREEVHRAQLNFFTGISHEFKTPLSLILAVTDTLRKEGLKEFYFRILNNNVQRLLHLVNELMLFRTVENGKLSLHLEMTDINAFVSNIAADFSDFARQHGFRFSIQADEVLQKELPVDRTILEKITINLLNNAFRYTPDGGTVSISIYSDADRYSPSWRPSYHVGNGQVADPFYIVVHDTGIGISEPSIHKIFERFYKVDASMNEHLGTGIGLALVKSLVMLHKGSVSVYSEREKGTDMVVALSKSTAGYREQDFAAPVRSGDCPQTGIGLMEESNIRPDGVPEAGKLYLRENKRILIAEDHEDLRKLIAGFLSPYYDIVEASNGVVASGLIRDMEIDLIISDIMMPLKDGISLCSEVKGNMDSSHIPFIMLTAKTGQESELEGAGSGTDVYLEKPVNFDLLLQVIRNIFKQQKRLKEYYAKYYFADPGEIPANRHDNEFLKKLYELLDANIDRSDLDVDYIASELSMSKSKLYAKLKSIAGKSLVEIILNYRLRKAARLIIEENLSMREVTMQVGIESQSYFTRMFKKEFGETPTAFAARKKREKTAN